MTARLHPVRGMFKCPGVSPVRLSFIRPLSPSAAVRPPNGDDWIHEPKWDGFRFQVVKDGSNVRFYSRHGAEYTDRLSGMAEAFGKLPTKTAILDGELCLIDPRGAAHFYRLMAEMRTNHPGRVPANVSRVRHIAPRQR